MGRPTYIARILHIRNDTLVSIVSHFPSASKPVDHRGTITAHLCRNAWGCGTPNTALKLKDGKYFLL
eukprot:5673686-Pyramimonas_sp.AAC.1